MGTIRLREQYVWVKFVCIRLGELLARFTISLRELFFYPEDTTTNFYGQNPVFLCTCEHVLWWNWHVYIIFKLKWINKPVCIHFHLYDRWAGSTNKIYFTWMPIKKVAQTYLLNHTVKIRPNVWSLKRKFGKKSLKCAAPNCISKTTLE